MVDIHISKWYTVTPRVYCTIQRGRQQQQQQQQ